MLVLEDGQVSIHLLEDQPYTISEKTDLAIESFPVLFHDSIPVDFRLPDRTARRTSIALDEQGKLVFILLFEEGVTLYELRDGLLELSDDLGLSSALNLDGGPSTGVSISAGEVVFEENSNGEVSSVLALFP
jgi:hypothetical protein